MLFAFAKLKVNVLDDDGLFIKNFSRMLESNEMDSIKKYFYTAESFTSFFDKCCLTYDEPEEIIDSYFQNSINTKNTLNCLVDLSSMPGLTIIDHNLDDTENDGIQVAKYIKEKNPKSYIVMLTSFVDDTLAIRLHNEKIIDFFIKKDSDNILNEVIQIIQKQKQKNLSIFEYDELKIPYDTKIITNVNYLEKLDLLIRDNNIVSYIITNDSGDIVGLDKDNEPIFYNFKQNNFKSNR